MAVTLLALGSSGFRNLASLLSVCLSVCPDRVLYCCCLSKQTVGYCPKPRPFPLSPSYTIVDARNTLSRCANFCLQIILTKDCDAVPS